MEYFSKVLQRGRLEEITFAKGERFVSPPSAQLETGLLSVDDTATLFLRHDEQQKRSSKDSTRADDAKRAKSTKRGQPEEDTTGSSGAGDPEEKDTAIGVVISLVTLTNGQGDRHSGLLLMTARLFRDGRLEPVLDEGLSPWIPSERLRSPAVSPREVMVGDLSRFWAFAREELSALISRSASPADASSTSFTDVLALAQKMFESVSGASMPEFAARQPAGAGTVQHHRVFIQEYERIDAVGGILDLYGFLGRLDSLPPLALRMLRGWDGARAPEHRIHAGSGLKDAALAACGTMSDGFALTPSQRRAVHAVLRSGTGEVTAVSGPPGTGKTTMLQAVVANLLTRHALEEGQPPLIVGTSTNNQAVTNIIESFASVTKRRPGSLDQRWLPAAPEKKKAPEKTESREKHEASAAVSTVPAEPLRSLAVYCPSKTKLAEEKKNPERRYLLEQANRSETYTAYTEPEYLDEARDYFVRRAAEQFATGGNGLKAMRRRIHDALAQIDGYRVGLIEAMAARGHSPEYRGICEQVMACPHLRGISGLEKLWNCIDVEALDEVLDVTLRYAEFWLAVHYYEAQWLLNDDILPEDRRWKNDAETMERYWRQAPALTPCFVMTLYQLPKYFRLWTKSDEPTTYDLSRIDLLIVDEAGQVDVPIGLPAFALASSAVVVGDEQQLAPVWSIDEQTDREMARACDIPADEWERELRERGLTCSAPSSLMRAASVAGKWSYGDDTPGLLLREHFRCHPRIIGFCNELLYEGRLNACRPSDSSTLHGLVPPFARIDVPDSQDARQGSSRVNLAEARAIAAWIIENYATFLERYSGSEVKPDKRVPAEKLIGVVTPFAAQARLIGQEIRAAAESASSGAALPYNLHQLITVGTAHRLQGAERPIILFSPVYGTQAPAASFIDANPQLMNVGVSRAKDLFLVFAAPNRWSSGKVFSLMSEFAEPWRATEAHSEPDLAEGADSAEAVEPGPVGPSSANPVRVTEGAAALTVSRMLREWAERDLLRPEDSGLTSPDFNIRLERIGVLEGKPGEWTPTRLAVVLGVREEERRNAAGEPYTVIEYSDSMQQLLSRLYRDGKL